MGKEDREHGEGGEVAHPRSRFKLAHLPGPPHRALPGCARQLPDVPFRILAAMHQDGFRKPNAGMWNALRRLYGQHDVTIGSPCITFHRATQFSAV